jgi:hypothetical protein
MPKRNEVLFFNKRNETERYFFWNRNQKPKNIFQKQNGTKQKKERFLTPALKIGCS